MEDLNAAPSCLFTLFIVVVVHHDHHPRRTPSLAQGAAERKEDKCFLLDRRCPFHSLQSRFRSFHFIARSGSPCLCLRTLWSVYLFFEPLRSILTCFCRSLILRIFPVFFRQSPHLCYRSGRTCWTSEDCHWCRCRRSIRL